LIWSAAPGGEAAGDVFISHYVEAMLQQSVIFDSTSHAGILENEK
jgi:hypothetical protein